MQPQMRKSADFGEFDTDERCAIQEIANDAQDEAASIARARVQPAVTTAWHKLTATAERYLIIEGEGRVEVEGLSPAAVTAGDVVRIPPDTVQRITNTGPTDLVFYAVCTPRFRELCYVSLEAE